MIETIKRLGRISIDVAWAGVILLAPITSLPLLSRLAGSSPVAPASFIPLCWLIVFWFILYLIRGNNLPRETLPFLLFVSIAIVVSALAFFINTPSFKGLGITQQETKAILTLFIGAAFYFVSCAWLFKAPGKISLTLKLITISGLILLTWALCQGIIIFFFHGDFPTIFYQFQALFSFHGLFPTRMNGFAYEPSWLGQELNLFYLPFWFAATLTGYSTFSLRFWRFTLENVLLVVGASVLFLSSRVSTLAFLLILAYLGCYFTFHLAQRLQTRRAQRLILFSPVRRKIMNSLITVGILAGFLGIFTLTAVVLVYALSHFDPRLARFFQVLTKTKYIEVTASIYTVFNYLQFVERYVYWVAGWNIFNFHSFLGVGLGNAGFYFPTALPAYGWTLREILDYLYVFTYLPNIKSLWVRLLAETGLIGFSAFITWCYVLLRSAWSLKRSASRLEKTIGWFGVFVLMALIIEGFSTDTFALPYLWIAMGIVSAMAASIRSKAMLEPNS